MPEHSSESNERKADTNRQKSLEFFMKWLGITHNPAIEIKGECWSVIFNCRNLPSKWQLQTGFHSGKLSWVHRTSFLAMVVFPQTPRYNQLLTRARSYCYKTTLHRSIKVSQESPPDIDCNRRIEFNVVHRWLQPNCVQACSKWIWRAVNAFRLTTVCCSEFADCTYAREINLCPYRSNWGNLLRPVK